MLERVASTWSRLLDGFWFVPGVVASSYVAVALVSIEVDRAAGSRGIGFAFQGDADAARDILTTIAGSLITVAGLAFSLTIVVLTLISSQFSPRAVRSLLADRVNQVIAGSFVGIFAYCLVVLRTIRDDSSNGAEFIPALGVTLAIGLALLSLALLLAFIHHAGTSIQLAHIAKRIGRASLDAVDRLYPDHHGHGVPGDEDLDPGREVGSEPAVIRATQVGYVQVVALDEIAKSLAGSDARVEVVVRPGDFVTDRTPMLRISSQGAVGAEQARRLRRAVVVRVDRDLRQDVAFGLRQLADIALRALSPGVNDPTTANTCVSYLGATLERLAERRFPPQARWYEEEHVLVVARRRDFEEYVAGAFMEIGRHASDNPRVVEAVLGALTIVADATQRVGALDRNAAVYRVARAVASPALTDARTNEDRDQILRSLQKLEDAVFDPFERAPTVSSQRAG